MTAADELPDGMLLDLSLGTAYIPTLSAYSLKQGNSFNQPVYDKKLGDIALMLGENCFYEARNADAYDFRIELDKLLQAYPDGCGFRLTYRALPSKPGKAFTNTAKFTGLGRSAHVGSSSPFEVNAASASGNAAGRTGNVSLEKVLITPDGTQTPAPNVTFTLAVKQGGQSVGTLLTPAGGKGNFSHLRFGDYIITETLAPMGYWITSAQEVTVDAINSASGQTVFIKNYANQIVATKQDNDTKQPLAGAQFQLYNASGVPQQGRKTTGANGECAWSNLNEGSYYIEEVVAPTGYTLSNVRRSATFVITRDTPAENAVLVDADAATVDGSFVTTGRTTPAFVFSFANTRTPISSSSSSLPPSSSGGGNSASSNADADVPPQGQPPATGDPSARAIFPVLVVSLCSACVATACLVQHKKRKNAASRKR